MKQSTDLNVEHQNANDLWTLLHEAQQIVVNHDHYHAELNAKLQDCLRFVETYQDQLLAKLYPEDND